LKRTLAQHFDHVHHPVHAGIQLAITACCLLHGQKTEQVHSSISLPTPMKEDAPTDQQLLPDVNQSGSVVCMLELGDRQVESKNHVFMRDPEGRITQVACHHWVLLDFFNLGYRLI
jgi:hypothetical protein